MNFLPTKLIQRPHFGLSISQSALRAVTLNSDQTVGTTAEIPLEPGIFDRGVSNVEALTQATKRLLESGPFDSKFVAVSLPEYHSFTRSHTLPGVPLSDVSEALSWQIEKIFPLPKDQIYFDWKLVSQSEDQINIVIVAVHKKILDDLVGAFEAAGLMPIGFEPSASGLSRIIPGADAQPFLVTEIDPYGSTSTLVEHGISTLTVTNQFTSQTSELNLQTTSQSIQSLIGYYQSKNNSNQQLQYILSGESANNELAAWLSAHLNQEFTVFQVSGLSPQFHQAYAAAYSSILPPDSEQSINLLPETLQNYFQQERKHSKLKFAFNISLIVLFISLLISAAGFAAAQFRVTTAQRELIQLQSPETGQNYNLNQISLLNKNSNTIVKLFANKSTPVNHFATVIQQTPDVIATTNINYQSPENQIVVHGRAPSRDSLLTFRKLLIDSGQFTDVNIPLGSLEKPENIDFTINLTLTDASN